MLKTPLEQKKIRTTIARYERNFKKKPHPAFDDGGGTRFLLGPLYLLLDDMEGAQKHYKWFARKFPDSSDDPIHTLSWALTLHRLGNRKDSLYRLRRAHLSNTFMIPNLLGVPHRQPDIKRFGNWETLSWIVETEPKYFAFWTTQDKEWLKECWDTPAFQEMVTRHIQLTQQLQEEADRDKRREIIETLSVLAQAGDSMERKLKLVKA